eukprot:m.143822 g.143822  ORF g.143822 m.143822 type:complete len:743 (+) comp23004_c0_seq2:229-2457(+)
MSTDERDEVDSVQLCGRGGGPQKHVDLATHFGGESAATRLMHQTRALIGSVFKFLGRPLSDFKNSETFLKKSGDYCDGFDDDESDVQHPTSAAKLTQYLPIGGAVQMTCSGSCAAKHSPVEVLVASVRLNEVNIENRARTRTANERWTVEVGNDKELSISSGILEAKYITREQKRRKKCDPSGAALPAADDRAALPLLSISQCLDNASDAGVDSNTDLQDMSFDELVALLAGVTQATLAAAALIFEQAQRVPDPKSNPPPEVQDLLKPEVLKAVLRAMKIAQTLTQATSAARMIATRHRKKVKRRKGVSAVAGNTNQTDADDAHADDGQKDDAEEDVDRGAGGAEALDSNAVSRLGASGSCPIDFTGITSQNLLDKVFLYEPPEGDPYEASPDRDSQDMFLHSGHVLLCHSKEEDSTTFRGDHSCPFSKIFNDFARTGKLFKAWHDFVAVGTKKKFPNNPVLLSPLDSTWTTLIDTVKVKDLYTAVLRIVRDSHLGPIFPFLDRSEFDPEHDDYDPKHDTNVRWWARENTNPWVPSDIFYKNYEEMLADLEVIDKIVKSKVVAKTNAARETGFPYRLRDLSVFVYQFLSGVRLLAVTVEQTVGNPRAYADPKRRTNKYTMPPAAVGVPNCTVRQLLLALAESTPTERHKYQTLKLPSQATAAKGESASEADSPRSGKGKARETKSASTGSATAATAATAHSRGSGKAKKSRATATAPKGVATATSAATVANPQRRTRSSNAA